LRQLRYRRWNRNDMSECIIVRSLRNLASCTPLEPFLQPRQENQVAFDQGSCSCLAYVQRILLTWDLCEGVNDAAGLAGLFVAADYHKLDGLGNWVAFAASQMG